MSTARVARAAAARACSQDPHKDGFMRLEIDEPTRPRNRRVIGRRLMQGEAEKVAQRERIARPPRDAALGVEALEIANQQQPEVHGGGRLGRPIRAV